MPPKKPETLEEAEQRKRLDERLDEALEESFPASDPPNIYGDDPEEKP